MIILKQLTPYDNFAGLEATWVDRTISPNAEDVIDAQVKCHSYHPTQMDMLRAAALSFNTSLTEYDSLINQIEANYIPPAPEPISVPQVITIRQAKLVLLAAGLLDDVDAAVAAADRTTQIEWEYATEVHRQWPTLVNLATAMGLGDEMLNELFIEGAKL